MIEHGNVCMGCGGCVVVCPYNAIQLDLNENGFYQANVNKNICVNCGICDKVCPITNRHIKQPVIGYSYKSNNVDTLRECASGGFGFDAALLGLRKNMPVCCVKYERVSKKPIHVVVNSETELKKTRNSIYLQSYSIDGFQEIVKQKSGVIIGTPCQLASMHNILERLNKRDKFFLIDFFCHGVPSYNLWKKYMFDYEKKSGVKNPAIQFRAKKYGWGNFTLKIQDNDHIEYVDFARNKNVFYKVFLENMALNECCYDCPYHGENSSADIRMGDFWGEKYKNDQEGVSALLIYSEKGIEWVRSLTGEGTVLEEVKKEVLGGQRIMKLEIPSCRTKLLEELKGKHTLRYINNTLIFKYKCIRRVRKILKKG